MIMKKIFFSIAALLCITAAASAQTLVVVEEKPVLTNKKGSRILPQAGDMALGVSVNPLFSYIKHVGRATGPESPTFESITAPAIYTKFFVHDNQAIRVGLSLNFGTDHYTGSVLENGNPDGTVTDTRRDKNNGFGVTIGYEWRRGRGRLQGFYGVEAGVGYSKLRTTYEYGNAMTTTYTSPYSFDFTLLQGRPMSRRTLESAGAANFNVGLYGFIGVEYFFAPKMSIGGEFNLGVVWNDQGRSDVTTQFYDQATETVRTETVRTRDSSVPNDGFSVRTTAVSNIALMFYF